LEKKKDADQKSYLNFKFLNVLCTKNLYWICPKRTSFSSLLSSLNTMVLNFSNLRQSLLFWIARTLNKNIFNYNYNISFYIKLFLFKLIFTYFNEGFLKSLSTLILNWKNYSIKEFYFLSNSLNEKTDCSRINIICLSENGKIFKLNCSESKKDQDTNKVTFLK
jgi:hypothetical protein